MTAEELKELSILFVDDESMQRMLMDKILSKSFKSVDMAEDGIKALEVYRENSNKYDLVITDFTMPKMNGWELVQSILDINPEQKIVILTANDPMELKEDYGCTANIIRKPFKRQEGITSLVELLS
ncbi:MAG: response regulator [Campylobacterales bacterium]|nr:response regulator [Campylobacterales bacterium]